MNIGRARFLRGGCRSVLRVRQNGNQPRLIERRTRSGSVRSAHALSKIGQCLLMRPLTPRLNSERQLRILGNQEIGADERGIDAMRPGKGVVDVLELSDEFQY